jgi:hypothetical protein
MISAARSHIVVFSGLRGRDGTLTWGQRSTWELVRELAPHVAHLNISLPVPVRFGCAVDVALEGIRWLAERHEALRTIYHVTPVGEPRQVVVSAGRIVVEEVTARADEARAAADDLVGRLAALPFTVAEGPLRVGLVTVDGVVRIVVLTFFHVATDGTGTAVVATDLRALICGEDQGPPPVQPLDQAAFERSDQGQRRNEASLRYWHEQLRWFPNEWLPRRETAPESPRYRELVIRSSALAAACHRIGQRCAATAVTVLVAGFAIVLGLRFDTLRCGFNIIANNRVSPELRAAVGNYHQFVPLTVDLTDATLDDIVRSTWQSTLHAYLNGRYDPGAMYRMIDEAKTTAGREFDLGYTFNVQHPGVVGPDAALRLEDPQALADQSTFTWRRSVDNWGIHAYLQVDSLADTCVMSLWTDTALIPSETQIAIARGLESVLVVGFSEDLHPSEIRKNLPGALFCAPDEGLVRVNGGWVDLDQVRALLRDALAPVSIGVFLVGSREGYPTIDAYLVLRDSTPTPTPAAVHDACMTHLIGRRFTTTPHRYVLCASAPECTADVVQWRARPILAEGPGTRGSGMALPALPRHVR